MRDNRLEVCPICRGKGIVKFTWNELIIDDYYIYQNIDRYKTKWCRGCDGKGRRDK